MGFARRWRDHPANDLLPAEIRHAYGTPIDRGAI
jgi:hypothetical protein